MGSRNYLVNVNDMSLSDRGSYKMKAVAAGIERCAIKGIGAVYKDYPALQKMPDSEIASRVGFIMGQLMAGNMPQSLTIRELTPALNGDLVAVTALDSWLTAALAAVGTFYSCFQAIASPQTAMTGLMVIYGMSVDSAAVPLPISRLVIRKGGATGNIIAQYDVEEQLVRQDPDCFFSEPIVVDPNQVFAVQARCRNATAVAEVVHINNFWFEQAGLIVV